MIIQTSSAKSTFNHRMPTYRASLLDNEHILESLESTQWLDHMAVLLGTTEDSEGNTATINGIGNGNGNGDFGPFDAEMFDPLDTFYEQVYLVSAGGVSDGSPTYTGRISINNADYDDGDDDSSSSGDGNSSGSGSHGTISENIQNQASDEDEEGIHEQQRSTATTTTTTSFSDPNQWTWQITTLTFARNQLRPDAPHRIFIETAIQLIHEHQMSVQIVLRQSSSSSAAGTAGTTGTSGTSETARTAGTAGATADTSITRINIREYLHETELRANNINANANANATTDRALQMAVQRLRLVRDLVSRMENRLGREMTGWDVMRCFFP